MEVIMEQLKVTGASLTKLCRLCLSRDMAMADVFLFSSELGKKIADVIMECAPVQITRHDKMPTNICQLCFTQLKKFHQFQMQAVRSDRTLQRYLRQLNDGHMQTLEELYDNTVNQNSKPDVPSKCEPLEIINEVDIFYSKQKVLANFSAINKTHEIFLKSEIKDEPIDDNTLIPTECADTVETLPKGEINCEDSMIDISDTKVDVPTLENLECSHKFENVMTEKIFVKSEKTYEYIPFEDVDSNPCPENFKDAECLRFNEDNLNRTGHPNKRQNINEKFDVCKILKKSSTSSGEKSNQCDICQMCFKQPCYLKKHKLIHTGEKPYQCDICKMSFGESSSLKRHTLIHTGEKPYRCDICKMCFRESGSLKRHTLIHTGEKPYRCDICKMCFRESGNLKKHSIIHTGEKPYQCDICQMCFKRVAHLKIHKLKHTAENPYQCDICKMCFSKSNSLKRHTLIHTGEKPYQCDICKMCFRESGNLKKHSLIHAGEKP